MNPSDNRPDPIDAMLAALREDDPTYTDDELDTGFNAVLTDLAHLTPERAREADDLATGAELGSDAHALGLEYLERGDLERAARWLRIAASHGVPAAEQQLQDARELRHTVDSVALEVEQQGPPAEQVLDCPGWSAALDWPRQVPSALESRLTELAAGRILQKARQEAERILAGARRAAARIATDAQQAAQPQQPLPRDVTDNIHRILWPGLNADSTHECETVAPWLCSTTFVSRGVDVSDPVMQVPILVWRRDGSGLLKRGLRSPLPAFVVVNTCHSGHLENPGQWLNYARSEASRDGLHNLIGCEAAAAYEQALEENDSSCLRLYMAADSQLMPRLLDWARSAPPAAAASVRKVLADALTPSKSGLVLPPGAQDVAAPVPAGAMR